MPHADPAIPVTWVYMYMYMYARYICLYIHMYIACTCTYTLAMSTIECGPCSLAQHRRCAQDPGGDVRWCALCQQHRPTGGRGVQDQQGVQVWGCRGRSSGVGTAVAEAAACSRRRHSRYRALTKQ